MFDTVLAVLGLKKTALIAGVVGGVVSLRFFDNLTTGGKLTTALCGAAAANFLTGPAIAFFQLPPPDYEGGIGFAIGLFSMSLAAATMKAIKDVDLTKVLPWNR